MARPRIVDPKTTVDRVTREALGVRAQSDVDASQAELERYRDTDQARREARVVSGSTSDGTALTGLITALKTQGVIVDGTETVDDEVVTGSVVADEVRTRRLNVSDLMTVDSFAQTDSTAANFVNGDFSVLGFTSLGFHISTPQDTKVWGDLVVDKTLSVDGKISDPGGTNVFDDNVTIEGNATVNGSLTVDGSLTLGNNVTADTLTVDSATTMNGNVIVDRTSSGAFQVRRDADGGDRFLVDTSTNTYANGSVEVRGGASFRLSSDGGTTNTGIWNANNGNITITGDVNLSSSVKILVGAGSPEGAVTAVRGSLFLRTDGGATTTLYVKTSGTGNTGWTAK